MLRLLNQLDVYKTLNNIRPPFMIFRTKDSQAFWMLFSVNTPCDQSDTLLTTCTLHPLGLGRGYAPPSSTSWSTSPYRRRCQRCLYVWPISCHRWRCGCPVNSVRYDDDDDESWKRAYEQRLRWERNLYRVERRARGSFYGFGRIQDWFRVS